jgi:AraC family transcriptional regulator of adaptative response / DNA-3-methyladenine glycosylase II
MVAQEQDYYTALMARDARFDGRFFVGVTSTRVYCRPICRVRLPLRKNCRFYRSAAEAQAMGFRPCLKCRPELAPERLALDAPNELAQRCMRAIRDGSLQRLNFQQLAARFAVSDRHLRRVFVNASGVSPVQYLTTCRLLIAKQLLTDSQLPVLEVAYASGFRSLRRFNAAFLEHYRMAPTSLRVKARRHDAAGTQHGGEHWGLTVRLPLRPPFDAVHAFRFLEQRAVAGVEWVSFSASKASYRRTVRRQGVSGCLEVRWQRGWRWLELHLTESLAPQLLYWLRLSRRVFDLDADPQTIQSALGSLAQPRPGLRLIGAFDRFELAVRAVLGQQITVKAARTLAGRLVQRYGTPVATNSTTQASGLSVAFPDAHTLMQSDPSEIAALGMPLARATCLHQLAVAWQRDQAWIDSEPGYEEFEPWLRAIRGIGPWTAAYISMRALSEPDTWLPGDVALRKVLGVRTDRELEQVFRIYAPWRSYAVLHLWAQAA